MTFLWGLLAGWIAGILTAFGLLIFSKSAFDRHARWYYQAVKVKVPK